MKPFKEFILSALYNLTVYGDMSKAPEFGPIL